MCLSSSVHWISYCFTSPARAVPPTVLPFWCHLGQLLQKFISQTACSPAFIWPVIKPGMLLFCLIFETAHDSHLFLYLTSFCHINLDSGMSQLLDLQCKDFTNASTPLCPSSSSALQHGSAPFHSCHAMPRTVPNRSLFSCPSPTFNIVSPVRRISPLSFLSAHVLDHIFYLTST